MAKGRKTGGRVAGTPNKENKQAYDIISCIVDNNAEKAGKMLDLIVDPKDWFAAYTKLLEYKLPKKAAVSVQADVKKSDLKAELLDLENQES